MVDGGMELMPGIGSDIALEGSVESAYAEVPLRAALSLFAAAKEIDAALDAVTCPILLFTSTQDHVVDPANSEVLVARVKGPVERITLDRSYHVATLDYDKDEIEARAVEFASGLLAPPA
jgi:carboxylesterase